MSTHSADSKVFAGSLVVFQAFIVGAVGALDLTYDDHVDPLQYGYFRDVSIMIFFGFGFLMTFMHRHGFSAIGYCLVISSVVIELSLVVGFLINKHEPPAAGAHVEGHAVTLETLLEGLFCAGTVMISFGAVLGKVLPTQLLVMAIVEVFGFWINFRLTMKEVGAHDVGGGMVIHTFGAYFGLAACCWVSKKEAIEHKDERSIYSSDVFSLAGTAFLFVLWPSFQSAVAGPEGRQFMAITNTFVSLCSSTIAFAAVSRLLGGKYNVVHLQNATLAGGVMMGCVGDMDMGLHGAMCAGFLAGTVSCVGYQYVTPWLNHIGVHDTCGVNNLHGMPGIMSAILAVVVVFVNGNGCAQCPLADKGFPGVTAGRQFYATLITIGVAIGMGTIAGVAMTFPLNAIGIDLGAADLYNDEACWHMPEFVELGRGAHPEYGKNSPKALAAVVPTDLQ